MIKYIIVLFSTALLGLLISWLVAGRLVAPVRSDVTIPETSLPVKLFTTSSQSGASLAGWHIDANTEQGVVVLLHGVRASRTSMFQRAQMLYESGYSSVLIDFQAHGESTGDRMTIGYLEKYDVLAAIEYATTHHVNEPVAVIGMSLGGASTLLAAPQNIDALIIESAYPDIRAAVHNRVKAKLGFLSWIPAEILLAQLKPRLGFNISELSAIENIDALNCPIFIISGSDDMHTTETETRQIYSRANEPKQLWIVKGAAHEDIYKKTPTQYKERVLGFLYRHMKNKPKNPNQLSADI
ncbi:MAG: alpha/beta hydrolase [Alteromonadaceae bacterium]|nr:MAG: alpha/beta hydrolase [Alteromonadaceae bacterium]